MNEKKPRSVNKPTQRPPAGQRTAGLNGAPSAQAARNTPNTARQNTASANKKRKSVRKAAKKPIQAKPNNSAKAPQRPQHSGQPAAKRPASTNAPRKTRAQSSVHKRHKYRGGNYILYYMLAGVVIITVLVILANTVLFRCRQIVVSGNARYTAEEIVAQSGLEMGKNLLHINTRQAEENIVSSLAYVESAKVRKSFPTGLDVTVTEAEKRYIIKEGSITAAVSRGGKIVEHCSPNGLTVITGYEPQSVEVGAWLRSKIDGKSDMPSAILAAVEAVSLEKVDEVDITDRFSIKMQIDGGRVILELGTVSDMESKLIVANKLIQNEISPTESVTILLSNPIQATVRRNITPAPALPSDNPPETGEPNSSSEPQT